MTGRRPNNLVAAIASQSDPPVNPAPATEPVESSGPLPRQGGNTVSARPPQGSGYADRHRPHTMMLPVALVERLNAASRSTGRSKADLARTAIASYLDEHGL